MIKLPFLVLIAAPLAAFLAVFLPLTTNAAVLSASPSSGTFTVGSTFEVSLLLNTDGKSVNALQVFLSFPPDKLQLISPSTGKSIISIWTAPPRFDNTRGRIELQGGIPNGLNADNALILTLTFRVKSVGSAVLDFLDNSRVLLNDGKGTDDLEQTNNGVYQFVLPAPAGPLVVSETHPDQSRWYSHASPVLNWAPNGPDVAAYSYMLSDGPVDVPDDTPEGGRTGVIYKNLADGIHYFHIKSLRGGVWGGTTHFAINIDTSPPAEFKVEVIPGNRLVRRQPVIQFVTTDQLSGVERYELKLVPLELTNSGQKQPLFIEVESPYVAQPLELGKYDVIVRAYDKAGNFREETERITITTAAFRFISDRGLEIRQTIIVPWAWVWTIAVLLIGFAAWLAWRIETGHKLINARRLRRELPADLKRQLEELQRYRARYGQHLLMLLAVATSLLFGRDISAQQLEPVGPPLVTTVSRDISNEEIFYVGGKTAVSDSTVIIYLQNLQTGETISQEVVSDRRGDWFYRHNAFLSTGPYLLWAQNKIGEDISPPSPQIQLTVRSTAIQFGASRISYETLYAIIIIALALILLGLVGYIAFHGYHARKKRKLFYREIKEAEEAVRRGFAVLRADIGAELAVIRRAKLNKALSAEEKAKEEQLLKDLQRVENYIGKEVWDVEKAVG